MKIVKCTRYVGTMIGPEGFLRRWTVTRNKIIQRTKKIKKESTKSLVRRLVDFKIYALSVFGYLGSISATESATPKEEACASQCITTSPYNAVPTYMRPLASTYWNPTVSPFSPSLLNGKKMFLKTSMTHSTMEAYGYVRHLDHASKITDSFSNKQKKAATILLRDEIPKREIAIPIAARVSRAFGPIRRHLTAQILPQVCHASQGFSPWASRWYSACSLQWHVYGTTISFGGRGTGMQSWMSR